MILNMCFTKNEILRTIEAVRIIKKIRLEARYKKEESTFLGRKVMPEFCLLGFSSSYFL